mmetsp:Transcript_68349/g.203352  ORF Transcript_68349/g.203352 Transcript_68349/m.203352 type:complete len:260 (-) Transcript_68349:134-913(-)
MVNGQPRHKDLSVPLAGLRRRALGHRQLVHVDDALHHWILLDDRDNWILLDLRGVITFGTQQRTRECAALREVAVPNLRVVHLLDDLHRCVRAVQAHVGRALARLRILRNVDLRCSAKEGEGQADLGLGPALSKAAHDDGVRRQTRRWPRGHGGFGRLRRVPAVPLRGRLPLHLRLRLRTLLHGPILGRADRHRCRTALSLRRGWSPRNCLDDAHPEALGLRRRRVAALLDLVGGPVVDPVQLLRRQLRCSSSLVRGGD